MPTEPEVVCKCGSKLFWESRACSGTWKTLLNEVGDVEDTDLDNIVTSEAPQTIKCAQCGKRNPNPRKDKTDAH